MNRTFVALLGLSITLGSGACVAQDHPNPQNAPVNAANAPIHAGKGSDAVKTVAADRDAFGYETDVFYTKSQKKVVFHTLQHSSIRIEYDGLEFEIDPVLKLGQKTIDYAAFPKADYILVTHEHFDHLDAQAIKTLQKNGTVILLNPSSQAKLKQGEALSNGDQRKLREDITLQAIPAYNTTPSHAQFHPKGRDNGYILSLDGFRIYIAGDTEDIPEMKQAEGADVAFLPCNQPYTMTVAQLAKAARMIQPTVLFPYHYSETPIDQAKDALKDSGIDLRIRNYQ